MFAVVVQFLFVCVYLYCPSLNAFLFACLFYLVFLYSTLSSGVYQRFMLYKYFIIIIIIIKFQFSQYLNLLHLSPQSVGGGFNVQSFR